MTATLGTTSVNHHVGRCPCCGAGLYINVDLATDVRAPRLSADGRAVAVANVTAHITAAEMEHHCTAADR